MTVQEKHRLWWIIGIVAAVLYFGPSLTRTVLSTARTHQPTGPTTPLAPPPPPPPSRAQQEGAALAALAGKWRGDIYVSPDRGVCDLHLEINPVPGQEDKYTGNTSLSCMAPMQMLGANAPKTVPDAMARTAVNATPTSTILSGAVSNGSIVFHVDQNIAVSQSPVGCDMTSLTATPFGAARVAITWKETDQGICHGGQLVANKSNQ